MDLAAEQILQILLDGPEIEESSAWLEVDEEIEVALLARGFPGNRAEDTHPLRAIYCRDAENFGPLFLDHLVDCQGPAPIVAGLRLGSERLDVSG
jgi:hypothetical protein